MKLFPFPLFVLFLGVLSGQHQDKVDFKQATVDMLVLPEEGALQGKVRYHFTSLQQVDSIFLDAVNLEIGEVYLNAKNAKFKNTGKKLIIPHKFKKNRTYTVDITYSCTPGQTVYFVGWDRKEALKQVWTQGQGKYTSHWLPSFDDMREKVAFELHITVAPEYTVRANGPLHGTSEVGGLKKWTFGPEGPMSSYLVAFAIGKYNSKAEVAASGVSIQLNYYPQDSLLVEPTYRYTQEIFDFLEREIGVPYPWSKYELVPVRDFLYAGMENTGLVVFSDGLLTDSIAFRDRNLVNVNAHELAHQWFGNLVTQQDGEAHWLHEGFASYYALLAEKELFGEPYYYWKLYESALKLEAASQDNKGEALLDPRASSLTFYEKGSLAVHMLRRLLGDTAYKKGIVQFLKKYGYGNATVADFLQEMEAASGVALESFKKEWLQDTGLPYRQVREMLVQESEDLAQFYALQDELLQNPGQEESILGKYWDLARSSTLRAKIIAGHLPDFPENRILEVLAGNDIEIRQALAMRVEELPASLKTEFESLLSDESYLTIAHILYKLWVYFPSDRSRYLEQTQNRIGFPDKNIRILWLALALLTPEYRPEQARAHYRELHGYTGSGYSFEVRQNAFQFMEGAIGFSDENLLDLVQAAQHHTWQFKKYARDLLDRLLQEPGYRDRFKTLLKQLNGEEKRYMENKLEKA